MAAIGKAQRVVVVPVTASSTPEPVEETYVRRRPESPTPETAAERTPEPAVVS